MPYPEIIELFDSGTGSLSLQEESGILDRQLTFRWLMSDKESYYKAEERALEIAPLYVGKNIRKTLEIRGLGNKWWEVSATYSNPSVQNDEEGGDNGNNSPGGDPVSNTISFDTTGGTEHVSAVYNPNGDPNPTQGGIEGQQGHWRPGEADTLPDLQGAIGVEGDQVKGVDRVVPIFNFSETWQFPAELVTESYAKTLYQMTGTVNLSAWRMFDPGEVLFMGARGEITRGAAVIPITFTFSARPNRFGFKVGDIEGIQKNGWDYMHVMYETASEAGVASIIKRPQFVFINCIYPASDFMLLNIGNEFPEVGVPLVAQGNIPQQGF